MDLFKLQKRRNPAAILRLPGAIPTIDKFTYYNTSAVVNCYKIVLNKKAVGLALLFVLAAFTHGFILPGRTTCSD
jgi:hypothetical protein